MNEIKRITDYRKLGLGMFLHYGLYNHIGKGEWYQEMYFLSTAEYYKLANLENLDFDLNVEKIVSTAKENGFKYIVLTSKHHEGFRLYDSKGMGRFDITKTKNKVDVVKKIINECLKNGIKPFLYYATWDWDWNDQKIPFEEQLKLINKDVEFLCQNYQGIAGFWFDGTWAHEGADWKKDQLYGIIRKYLPEAIIVDNSGTDNLGNNAGGDVDVITFEQGSLKEIDYSKFSRDMGAEVCQTFNDHWGIATEDYQQKSLASFIFKFVQSRKEKANYLINMSVDGTGNLQPLEVETIKKLNQWIKKYGYMLLEKYEVINRSEKDFIIQTENGEMYLFLYDLGIISRTTGKILPKKDFKIEIPMKEVTKLTALDNNEDLKFFQLQHTWQTQTTLTVVPTTFDYGYNCLIRVIKIEHNDKNFWPGHYHY